MNCDQIQPELLDYAKGLLSGPESRKIRAHLQKCSECAAILEEEIAFSREIAGLPDAAPINDVWALVRARTRPRTLRPLTWLGSLRAAPVVLRRAMAATAAAAVIAAGVYTFWPEPPAAQPEMVQQPRPSVTTVRWSDDPLGGHTDAMVKLIDNM